MRYSKVAASLLSTVFTFRAKSYVVAGVFDSSNEAPGPTLVDTGILSSVNTSANGTTANPTSSPTPAIELKEKCKPGDTGCVHGRIRVPANKYADTGILASPLSAAKGTNVAPSSPITVASHHLTSLCTPGTEYVICVNGHVKGYPGVTCYEACGDGANCCSGIDACKGFSGRVCKDTISCSGDSACAYANIPWVVRSCKELGSCFKAGYGMGSIESIVDSCIGDFSCYNAAAYFGSIGKIQSSCNGIDACNWLGYDNGLVGDVLGSCNADSGCEDASWYGGSIGSIIESCNQYNACHGLGQKGGKVGDVTKSCTARYSCYYGAEKKGSIWSISNSCYGEDSCRKAGSDDGSIGNIAQSCKADNACTGAGSGLNGRITSNLMSCCNTGLECDYATQASLPATCNAAPTSAPTNSKSAKKRARTLN